MGWPNVADALDGWNEDVVLELVTKEIVDHQQKETIVRGKQFRAVLQPMPPQRLLIKPEGQRHWKWWTMWSTQALNTDDIVRDRDKREFRVMRHEDWGMGGYRQYELAEMPIPS